MSSNTETLAIANTIKSQIIAGCSSVFVLGSWGARKFVAVSPCNLHLGGLAFQVSGRKFSGMIRVILDFNDTYSVQFIVNRGAVAPVILDGIYADMLATVIDERIES